MSNMEFSPELFACNWEALAQQNILLATALSNAEPDPGIEILQAKNGGLTISVDGRMLLSAYAPERDADSLVQEECGKQPNTKTIIVLGFELGLVTERLLAGTNSEVIVYEPRLGVLRAVLGMRDLTAMLAEPRLTIVHSIDQLFIRVQYTTGMAPDLSVLILPGVKTVYEAYLEALHARIKDQVQDRDLQVTTMLVKQREWFDNLIENFSYYAKLPSVTMLNGAMNNRPAVIVSAGPSLDKNVHLLKNWKNHGLIISVGTALKKCVKLGVVPDLTIALESNDILGQFENVPELLGGYTVLNNRCHPKLWQVPARGTFSYSGSNLEARWITNLLDRPKATLAAGGSVSTVAFSLALSMGCNPVVIIGQDLAFGKAGESHATGIGTGGIENVSADRMDRMLNDDQTNANLVLVDGYYGDKVVTRINMRNYLLWFEKNIPLAVQAGFRVVNCTEGGAKILGTEQMPFAEATEAFLHEPFDVIALLDSLAVPEPFDLEKIRQEVADTIADMKQLEKIAQVGKKQTMQVQELFKKKPVPVAKIDRMIYQITRHEKQFQTIVARQDHLLSAISNKAMLLVETAFDYSGLKHEEMIMLNMKHTATMYQAMIDAAETIRKKMEWLAAELETF